MNNPLQSKFGKVLATFTATLTPDEADNFRFVTLDDLKQTVAEIQAEQGSSRRLQNLRRLDAFLEAMEQYDKVVQIFLNAADLLAFIWTASTWSESFNTLLDAYEEIGDHIPLLEQYEGVIRQNPKLRIVLELVYKDVLDFHRRAIKHFKNKVWKQLFHATWKTFRTDFQAVLRSLQSHKRLLDSQGILIGVQASQRVKEQIEYGIQESQKIGEVIENERQQRQKDEESRRRREVFTWLAAVDSAEDQEIASEARSTYPTAGHWILRENLVTQWCDPHSQTEPCLWINGKPGAGKTVLASVLVEKCANISNTDLAYFYCRAEDCNRNTFIGVCRSLICQLSQRDTSVLSYVYEKLSSSGRSQLDSISVAKEMLGVVLSAFGKLFIIIDGIDECKKVEKERISSTLISIVESHTAFLRCCFISQHDKDTGKIFRNIPTFRITEKHNGGDILDYCVGMEKKIARSFHVSGTDLQNLNISRNVAAKADGMFLFAKLVMENLLQQCTRADLEAEIERIPPDLDKAYSRLLSRILHDAPLPEQRVAKRLLCWLLCTQRPLKWHEIQGAMSIDTEKLIFDYQGRHLVKDLKTFCGSLVEVRKGGTIELVHQTARSFLRKQEELQLGPEEVNFTCICLGNLTLPSHDDDNSEDSIRGYIQEGCYSLSDYSVVYWQEHVNKIIRGKALDTEESLKAFNAVIHAFLTRRFTPDTKTTCQGGSSTTHLKRFKSEVFYPRLVQAMECSRNEPGSPSESSKDCRPVLPQLLKVRGIMERMVLKADTSLKERLQMLYGPNIFKCSEPQCSFFHEGFSVASKRNTHRNKHRRAFLCTYPGCPSALIGFTTSAELNKHNVDYHGDAVDRQSFPWNGKVASIDIEKQIKNGNLSEVQAWADQWGAKIPMEKVWFSSTGTDFGESPLGVAIRFGNRDIFETLLFQAPDDLFRQANITSGRVESRTLFETAMKSGNENTTILYLRKLDSIDASLFREFLSLKPEENTIALFLSHAATNGGRVSKSNALSYLKVAVEREDEAATRYILHDIGLWEELNRGPRSPKLDDLGVKGHFQFLIKILPEISKSHLMVNSRLHHSCLEGNSHQVAALLQNDNVKPNYPDKYGFTPLRVAIENKQFKAIHQLLADPRVVVHACQDAESTNVLYWAVRLEHKACIDLLLSEGIPVQELTRSVSIDGMKKTAIEVAKTNSAPDVLSLLEGYRNMHMDWSLYPEDSTMLLRVCSTADLPKVRNALRRAPHDLDAPDSRGMTPFQQAVKCGKHHIVQFLLEQGCHAHCSAGPARISPLMFAVMNDDLEMVRLLLSKACVDPTYEDEKGWTALDYLNPESSLAEEIRNDIQDAIDVALLIQNEIQEHEMQDAMGMALLFQDVDG